jgi:hypothetical protein
VARLQSKPFERLLPAPRRCCRCRCQLNTGLQYVQANQTRLQLQWIQDQTKEVGKEPPSEESPAPQDQQQDVQLSGQHLPPGPAPPPPQLEQEESKQGDVQGPQQAKQPDDRQGRVPEPPRPSKQAGAAASSPPPDQQGGKQLEGGGVGKQQRCAVFNNVGYHMDVAAGLAWAFQVGGAGRRALRAALLALRCGRFSPFGGTGGTVLRCGRLLFATLQMGALIVAAAQPSSQPASQYRCHAAHFHVYACSSDPQEAGCNVTFYLYDVLRGLKAR